MRTSSIVTVNDVATLNRWPLIMYHVASFYRYLGVDEDVDDWLLQLIQNGALYYFRYLVKGVVVVTFFVVHHAHGLVVKFVVHLLALHQHQNAQLLADYLLHSTNILNQYRSICYALMGKKKCPVIKIRNSIKNSKKKCELANCGTVQCAAPKRFWKERFRKKDRKNLKKYLQIVHLPLIHCYRNHNRAELLT